MDGEEDFTASANKFDRDLKILLEKKRCLQIENIGELCLNERIVIF